MQIDDADHTKWRIGDNAESVTHLGVAGIGILIKHIQQGVGSHTELHEQHR